MRLPAQRGWCLIAEQPAPAPHLAYPAGCAALRIVLVTVPRVSRSCEHFPDGFDLHLLRLLPTTPNRGGKSSFQTALICTTRRRIPASPSAKNGSEKCDLKQERRLSTRRQRTWWAGGWPGGLLRTPSLSLCVSLSHTHTLSLIHTHTHFLSPSLSHTHIHTHTLSLSLTHTHTH